MNRLCNVTNKYFDEMSIRRCIHPEVVKTYGVNEKCFVSVWVCKKCKHKQKPIPGIDGYKCIYKGEK